VAAKLTPKTIKLIEGKNFGFLATLMRDGSPHVTPVWVDYERDAVLINTSVGQTTQRNMKRDPRVSIVIVDQDNPYDRVIILGRVVAQTQEGAEEHVDKLAEKYTGANKYQRASPTEKRIMIKIQPSRIL
jgi:PPOX class probable F420-dependent enzyme